MNTKQRIIILAGIALIALMLLVPPWRYYRESRGEGSGTAGYGLIFDSGTRLRIDLGTLRIGFVHGDSVYLDTSALAVQCLLVAVITSGFAFLFQTRKN